MKARVSHLHKTEAEWLKLGSWKPEAGELIIYDPDAAHSYARLKVGDGVRTLKDLEFFVDNATLALIQKQRYFEIIDAGRVTDYKKK
jgi:hypothetical protein